MRKALFVTILLLLLSAAGMSAAAVYVNLASDDVVLTEEILRGDAAAAEGLEITLDTSLKHQLFWNTVLRTGTAPESSTDYEFTVKKTYSQNDVVNGSFELYSDFSFEFMFADEVEGKSGLESVCNELYALSEASGGLEYSKEVYVKDYYDYYPIQLFFTSPYSNKIWNYYYDTDDADYKIIQDFFRIPVLEDEQVSVSVSASGSSASYGLGSVDDGDSFNLYSYSAVTEKACYFTFDPHSSQGKTVDLSLIPGGYGIYRIGYDLELLSADGRSIPFDASSLEMVYPLDTSVDVFDMRIDIENEKLLLFTMENERFILTVIELDTMETLQKVECCDSLCSSCYIYYYADDYLVFRQTRQSGDGTYEAYISLIAKTDDGSYELRFNIPMESENELGNYRTSEVEADYDGERLALVYPSYQNCEFLIAVYDADGLGYLGRWLSSLDTDFYDTYSYNDYCQIDEISVFWK